MFQINAPPSLFCSTIVIREHVSCDKILAPLYQVQHAVRRPIPEENPAYLITHKQAPKYQELTVAKESDSFHVSSHLWTWDDCILGFDPQHTDSINNDPLMSLLNREVCERKWYAFLNCSEQDSFLGYTLWNGDLIKTNLD